MISLYPKAAVSLLATILSDSLYYIFWHAEIPDGCPFIDKDNRNYAGYL